MVTKPSLLPTASQAQHNTKVANPWILTPKKKKKPVQSKLEINPRSRHWQRKPNTIYTKQKQTKPHYPILQYRFVYQKKKKPNTEKTKP